MRALESLACALFLTACTAISGNKVVPTVGSDREPVSALTELDSNLIPLLTQPLNGRQLKIYKIAFDGTLNDATRKPADERPTVVAHIAQLISAKDDINSRYYPGPGMHNPTYINVPDAALGYTSAKTAQEAEHDLIEQATKWVAADPNVEIRVFVTGFSRGAATARHFMNIVTRDWGHGVDCKQCSDGNSPEFFAVLYDTVATFQMESLDLSLPPSVNFLIHVVAIDEFRPEFEPLIDAEYRPGREVPSKYESALPIVASERERHQSWRFHLIEVPGSHSDIGASYPEGVGDVYREMTEIWLRSFGLIQQNCWELLNDPYSAGKHDSRGWLDKLRFAPSPNSARSVSRATYVERAQVLSEEVERTLKKRLDSLVEANFRRTEGIMQIRREQPSLRMEIVRHGQSLVLLDLQSPYADRRSFRYEVREGVRRASFRYLHPFEVNQTDVVLNDDIWSRLKDGMPSVLSYGVLRTPDGGIYISADVDGVFVSVTKGNEGPTKTISSAQFNCARGPDGTLESPWKAFVLTPESSSAVPAIVKSP